MTVPTQNRLRPQPDPGGGRSRLRASAADSERIRILVVMATFVGSGYIVYSLIAVPVLLAQADAVAASWFPPVGVLVVFGPGLMLMGARFVGDPARWIAVWVTLCQVGVVAGAALWGVAGVRTSPEPSVWMLEFVGIAGVAAGLVWRMPWAVAAVVVAKSSAAFVALVHQEPADVAEMARDAVFGVLFTTLFVCIAVMVVRAGAALDASRTTAAALVEAKVRNAELARFDGLIHDHVISTLVAAGSDQRDPRVPALAASALNRLDDLAADTAADGEEVPYREAVARLRAVIGPNVDTVVNIRDDMPDRTFPTTVVRALAEAVGESVRNSVLHAGDDADRAVVITVDDRHLAVAVVDDGTGFDPSTVRADRLGIALSVRRRLDVLPGGRAVVQSAVGAGTRIEVSWTSP